MKIAVCISGQPRFLEEGYKQIYDNIISKYNDVDFFIHTWWQDDMIGEQLVKAKDDTYKLDDFGKLRMYNYPIDTIELIMKYYKPKIILNEPQIKFKTLDDVDYESINPVSLYSMFYSIKISNELKKFYEIKNNFKYDVVIRCRFDILIEKFEINLYNFDSSFINTHSVGNGFPNDQLAISNSENMDYYSSLFDKIEEYYNNGFRGFVGERLLRHHLNDKFLISEKIKNNIIKN
jgi:hypothetical protein